MLNLFQHLSIEETLKQVQGDHTLPILFYSEVERSMFSIRIASIASRTS